MNDRKLSKSGKSLNYKIAMTGVFGALSIILAFTPIGYIQVGALAITIMHVPTILATLTAGLIPGITTGLIFGISSLIVAATSGTASNVLFINPLVSVLPRVLFPVIVWGIFKLFDLIPHNPKTISSAFAAAFGTLAHTFLVLGFLCLIYGKKVGLEEGKMLKGFFVFVGATIATNGIWEILTATILTVLVMGAIYGVNYRKSKLTKLDNSLSESEDENFSNENSELNENSNSFNE